MKILVVDDHPDNRYLMEVMLKSRGYEAALAGNGEEGLEMLKEEKIDLIISDILMPKMDGYRFCREVKADPDFRKIPFIFITSAYTDEKDEQFALSLGADRFLRRPVEPDSFLAAVEEALGTHPTPILSPSSNEETRFLSEYGERVVNQLERKVAELEREIEERTILEESLSRVNRALRVLSAGNTALVHAEDEKQLVESVCRVVVETGGYRMAWVGYVEESGLVKPVAHSGTDGTDLEMRLEEPRATCAAIRKGKVQYSEDIMRDPEMVQYREEAARQGYASCIALPLKNEDRILGALTIYSGNAGAFGEDEIALLSELAADLSYGIESIRTRAEREEGRANLLKNMEATIQAIAATVEMRDPYTAGHQRRVAELAEAIGRELGLSEDRVHGLYLAGIVHDVGKINIPAEILVKPGRLSDLEYDLIKIHPKAGFDILKGIEFPWPVARIVHQHHERLDGSGYPEGLKGEEILQEAKILAVADVVEAMSSHRPYRAGLGTERALSEISNGRGVLFDQDAVDACERLIGEKGFVFGL